MKVEKKTIENDEVFLRQVSKPVDFKRNDWRIAYEMLDTFCKQDDAVFAMAAIQIGIPLRMVYLKNTKLEEVDNDYNESKVLINPIILNRKGLTQYWEACASCLDYTGLVKRPYELEVLYYDLDGYEHKETFLGFAATVLSHEMDHLEGILHIDIAECILQMTMEERREFRLSHPYEVIRKDGDFISGKE